MSSKPSTPVSTAVRAGCAAALLLVSAVAPAQTAATPAAAAPASAAAECPALLNHTFARLQDEKPQPLCQYAGKVLLVVNTASRCGFAPQFEGLEKLHAKYGPQGLVVMGFPSNDFGQQELDTSKQIADFCFNTYGVKFPMFEKTRVKGPQANAFYAALAKASGRTPAWNFHKYLVDRRGVVVGSWSSNVTPDHPELVAAVENALSAK